MKSSICISTVFHGLMVSALWFAGTAGGQEVTEGEWSRFRGPNGTGVSHLQGVPTQWTLDDYEWRVELPGIGHSSPIVWEDKLFITAGRSKENEAAERIVVCLNALTGKTLWTNSRMLASNHLHAKNSYGSGTPVADAERVYFLFADESQYLVIAFDHQGEELWMRDLGPFSREHGQGVSPIVFEDLLIVPNDQTAPGESSLVALDKATGETRWILPRSSVKGSFSTPMILDVPGQGTQLIVLTGGMGFFGVNPKSGKELWASGRLPQRSVASPVFVNGLLIGSCGQGGRGELMVAVKPGTGEVKAERSKSLPYVPTPLVKDSFMYMWNDNGVAYCVDMTGDLSSAVWEERIGGKFSASPVMIDGKIYCPSEEGEVVVIDASPKFKSYGSSPLGDQTFATPAVANGRVYFRGFSSLASLKAK